MPQFVYILRNPQGLLYVGHTGNLWSRLRAHRTRKGAKFVRNHRGFKLVYLETYTTQTEAVRREEQIKRWRRAKKEALIAGNLALLKKA